MEAPWQANASCSPFVTHLALLLCKFGANQIAKAQEAICNDKCLHSCALTFEHCWLCIAQMSWRFCEIFQLEGTRPPKFAFHPAYMIFLILYFWSGKWALFKKGLPTPPRNRQSTKWSGFGELLDSCKNHFHGVAVIASGLWPEELPVQVSIHFYRQHMRRPVYISLFSK